MRSLAILLFASFFAQQGMGPGPGLGQPGGGGGGGISVAAGTPSTQIGTSTSITASISCASGKTLIVGFSGSQTGLAVTFSDSASNTGWATYSATQNGNSGFSGSYAWWGYNFAIASSVTSVTVTYTSTNASYQLIPLCVTGLTGHKDFTQAANHNTSTAITSGTFTTSTAAELVCTYEVNQTALLTSATSPAVLEVNQGNTGTGGNTFRWSAVLCTIYASTQSGVTQAATLSSSGGWDATTGGWY